MKFFVDDKKSNKSAILCCVICAQATGVPLEFTKPTTITPSALSPFGRLPILLVEKDNYLYETVAICKFLLAKQPKVVLIPPQEKLESFQVEQIVEMLQAKLDNEAVSLNESILSQLDKLVSNKKYVVGDALSLADIAIFSSLFSSINTWSSKFTSLHSYITQLEQEKVIQKAVKVISE